MSSVTIDFNALSKPHWDEEQTFKARKVIHFVQQLMNDHNFEEITRQFEGKPYLQHNRTIEDGIQGVVKSIGKLVKNAPEFSYDVKRVFVDGDHVILHSHVTLKARHRGDDRQGFNIIDTWRLDNGELVEHWDAIQGLSFSMRLYAWLSGGALRNANGVF